MRTPPTPEPIIIREQPPPVPPLIPKKIITIPGKVIPAKRSVIIEKVESKPPKPPMIIIERWLPYDNLNHKRNVIYQKAEKNLDRKKNQGIYVTILLTKQVLTLFDSSGLILVPLEK